MVDFKTGGFMKKVIIGIILAAAILPSCSSKKTFDPDAKFTYRISSSTPTTWSPTDFTTGNETTVLNLTGKGLYDFIMNKTKDGYDVVCEMAKELPQDVTKDFAGNKLYSVPSDAKEGYAWKFELNPDAVWEDGTPINAGTWEYTIKQFLNPQMKNYRASSFYQDTLALAGAEDYYNGKTEWENVGFIKNNDYSFTLVLTKSQSLFYIEYATSSSCLVHPELYEANKKQAGDIIKSAYGTSIETYSSYGPYKITIYQPGKEMLLEKNETWYGWKDGKHDGQYMTTGVYLNYTTQHTTLLSLFLQGKLDSIALDADDLELYGNSSYRITEPESYTWKYTFNSDRKSLLKENSAGINHVLPAYKDFRKGVSLALNRQLYVDTITPASTVGFGLLNYMYISNPETGELYRETKQAEQILCELYGTSSVDDITGYDKELAAKHFESAYNQAIAAGDAKPTDKFQIDLHTFGTNNTELRSVAFLQDSINEATKGTPLEGKISVIQITDEDYYNNLQKGQTDCAMTAWGGSSFDPYGCTWCYCAPEAINEYGFNPEKETLSINVNGTDITDTYYNWYNELCNGKYSSADYETRVTILSQIEKGILSQYNSIPIRYYNSSSLDSHRIINGSDHYINSLVGFGGLRFMTYSMSDEEWDAYCKENNNQLKY